MEVKKKKKEHGWSEDDDDDDCDWKTTTTLTRWDDSELRHVSFRRLLFPRCHSWNHHGSFVVVVAM